MADPKLPKQLSDESVLDEFTKTGNIYVDPAFKSQADIDKAPINGKSPITEEALTFSVNAFSGVKTGDADSITTTPDDGHAVFVTNASIGGNLAFGRSGSATAFDVYVKDTKINGSLYLVGRKKGNEWTADSDGDLNVYVEGVSISSNYQGFAGQDGLNFTGNYVVTIKNLFTQYFALSQGSAWGAENDNQGNQRLGLITGNLDVVIDGTTATSVGSLHRGGIVGAGGTKAHVTALIKDSNFRNQFIGIHTGVSAKGYQSNADMDITITGSTFNNAVMLLPNASNNDKANAGDTKFTGNINLLMTGSTITSNGLVIGAGRNGGNTDGAGWVDGDITFKLSGSTVIGRTIINKGKYSTAEKPGKIDGTIINSDLEHFNGLWANDSGNEIYVDDESTIKVIDSKVNNLDIGDFGAKKVNGALTVEVTGSTLRRAWTNRRFNSADQSTATFNLVFKASDTTSVITSSNTSTSNNDDGGGIRAWDNITIEKGADVEATFINGTRAYDAPTTLTVEAGSSLRLGSLEGITSVIVKDENILTAGSLKKIGTLSVTGEVAAGQQEFILVGGVTSIEDGDITTVTLNGVEGGRRNVGGN